MRSARLDATRLVGSILTLLPILMVTVYVARLANLAPVGDQWWDVGYIAVKTRAGLLTVQDLFTYFAGHRPVLIRLHTVLFTWLTGYDVRLLRFTALLNAVVNLLIAALLFDTHVRQQAGAYTRMASRVAWLVGVPLFSLIIFTLHHADSWLDYYFAVWQQPLFFLLLGALIIERAPTGWWGFVGVLSCAVGSTFTLGLGIAAWASLAIALFAKAGYRRWTFAFAWMVGGALCVAFYTSNYAPNPYESQTVRLSLETVRQFVSGKMLAYLIQYPSARFDTSVISIPGIWLVILCTGAMVADFVYLWRRQRQFSTAALWASLALFALGGAILTALGRGPLLPTPPRYSPGADGFWIAFAALALLTLVNRPGALLTIVNVSLIATTVILTAGKDVATLTRLEAPFQPSCDQCVRDYPLQRGDCYRTCFVWGDEQSVYQMALLRLSVFRDSVPSLVLPDSQSPVIADMPNQWLSVFVRDTMLPGVPLESQFHIAPRRTNWPPPHPPISPFYRTDSSIDGFPHPLTQVWETADQFAAGLSPALAERNVAPPKRWWVLLTPETASDFPVLDAAFAARGYRSRLVGITNPRYADARFTLWCVGLDRICFE